MRILRIASAVLFIGVWGQSAELKIRLLATTDLHGNLLPYDYFTGQPAARGLAKIATLIQQARAENPNTLLIDCGDTIQGTPLEGVYQHSVQNGSASGKGDPMMSAMNLLGYDAMVVGNHEFNYGLKNLGAARAQARFPWISSNIRAEAGSQAKPFAPYFVKTIAGVKIAIVGVTTPLIPLWELPDHYRGYKFDPAVEAVRAAVEQVRQKEHPAIVIVAAHSGLDHDPAAGENSAYQIATEVKGIDAVVFGHSHQQVAQMELGEVLLMQPKNWGISLGEMDFVVSNGKVISKSSKVIPVTPGTQADSRILDIARPFHMQAEKYLDTFVAEAPADLDSRLARVEDSALIDAIQQVQLFYAKADVSFASSFNSQVRVAKGPVTIREVAALYVYDNQLYAIEGNGKMVREALENAARYFRSCTGDCGKGPLINPQVVGFNYDMAAGVNYEIDLTKPAGQRIQNLKWKGEPLKDDQPLRIALNNYRAGGSAGYSMFQDSKIVWRSTDEIRDLIVKYYTEHKELPAKPDGNWRIVPEAAHRVLQNEAQAEAQNAVLK